MIKSCRELGRGPGGFYQPGYRDGAKLHLKMMCLGKNWDPEASSYGDTRPIDEAKPPPIPDAFARLVKGAIQECHDYLESNSKVRDARNVLPSMSPDICIINFYTMTGKLGLHQVCIVNSFLTPGSEDLFLAYLPSSMDFNKFL